MAHERTTPETVISPSGPPVGGQLPGNKRPDALDRVAHGAMAGVVATGAMSAVIAAGRAARLLRTPPPAQITATLGRRIGVRPDDGASFTAGWLMAHLGYGALCGVVYVAARPVLPGSAVPAGLFFGVVVWGGSYAGLMPALGLYPQPEDDSAARVAVMLLAHAVFGVSLAETERRLAHRR